MNSPHQNNRNALFPLELRRLQYLLRWLIWAVSLGLGAALLAPLPIREPYPMILFVAWILLAIVYKIVALDIPRLKNAGMSPWLLLLVLVPIANFVILIILFVAPPKGPNQSPEPTVMSVTPPAAQEPRQP